MPLSRNSVLVVCAEKPVPHRVTRSLYKPKHQEEKLVYEVTELEKDIRASTKARLDMQRVAEILEEDTASKGKTHAEDWQVSLAASSVAAAATFGITDSWTFAVLAFAGTYILANGDPLEEQAPYGEHCTFSDDDSCKFAFSSIIPILLWFDRRGGSSGGTCNLKFRSNIATQGSGCSPCRLEGRQ